MSDKKEINDRQKKLYDKTLLHPVFDRQLRIPNWNQEKIEKTVALCLGVGGLGSTVCAALCRLGIKKMYILDFDVVDEHNLNRQTLFSKKQVDVLKVEAGKETLDNLHNIQTEVITMNMNALTNWGKIVKACSDCTVVFNMIDVGGKLDDCVQAMCIYYKIPLIQGGTFQNFMTFDICEPGGPCLCCMKTEGKVEEDYIKKIQPEEVVKYKAIDHFVKKEENPVGASNYLVASTCSNFMVSMFINYLMGTEYCGKKVHRGIFYMNTFDMEKWEMEKNAKCYLCGKK